MILTLFFVVVVVFGGVRDDMHDMTGGVDVLINNAGVSWFGSIFDEKAIELFDRVIAINVRCAGILSDLM